MSTKTKLGSVLKIMHGYAFKSENYVAKSEYRLVTLGNFEENNNCFKYNDEKATYYGAEFPSYYVLDSGDLIMPLTEQVIGLFGNSAFVPKSNEYSFVLNQRVGKVICNEKKVDKYFVHYLLATNSVKKQLEARASGTRQRNISPDDVYDVEVFLPELPVQKMIGETLFNIEQKQENNNSIHFELDAMAKLLYDYWFVQFDFPDENGKPYKSSGGKMVWSEKLKREIPDGWKVGNLYDIADYINGLACQKYRPINENKKLPVIKINEMHNGFRSDVEWARDDIPQNNIINYGDILFSWSATLEVMLWNNSKSALNQHIFKVLPKGYNKYYVYQQLSGYVINFVRMAEARKTTMGHITADHLNQSCIALPPKELTEEYGRRVNYIYDKIMLCSEENQQLTSLRDFLLPMLMNGQVKVGKSETE